jgi:hypothetical protein
MDGVGRRVPGGGVGLPRNLTAATLPVDSHGVDFGDGPLAWLVRLVAVEQLAAGRLIRPTRLGCRLLVLRRVCHEFCEVFSGDVAT